MRVLLFLSVSAAFAQETVPVSTELRDLLTRYVRVTRPSDRARRIRIETAEQWAAKRADISVRVRDMLGHGPAIPAPALDPTFEAKRTAGSYDQQRITYVSSDGDRVPAWLLIPKHRSGKAPAVLAVHPTSLQGKDSVTSIGATPHERYGHELAERGYVVLAPDVITSGERKPKAGKQYETAEWDAAHPEWSAMGKMLADHMRGVDLLQSLPEVDGARIAVIGHSLGGYNAFFLGAFDDRIKAAISSCGFAPIAQTSRPFAWSRGEWFDHFPKMKSYLRDGIVPFDMHEVMAMMAPRAMFNWSAATDAIFPDASPMAAAGDQVRQVYRMLGAEDRFAFVLREGPHSFPDEIRQRAYDWLDRQLR